MFYPTYLRPDFIYGEKLDRAGVNEDMIHQASNIVTGALGTDFLQETNNKILNRDKNGIAKFLGAHLIYQYFTIPTADNVFRLIELSEILKTFYKSTSMKEYIARMKDTKKVYPAIFELLFAKKLSDTGHIVELQKKNPAGNPVEVFTNIDGLEFRIECKTSEVEPVYETFCQKIIRKLNDTIESLPNRLAVNIILSDNIQTSDLYKVTADTVMNIKNILHKHKYEIDNITSDFKLQIDHGDILFFKFSENDRDEREKYFHTNSTEYRFSATIPQEIIPKIIPDSTPYKEDRHIVKMFGIKYDEKLHATERKKKGLVELIADIKEKISQQKSLLMKGAEVVIVLEEKSYDSSILTEITPKDFMFPYENLSIILARYQAHFDTGSIEKNYICLLESKNLKKLIS